MYIITVYNWLLWREATCDLDKVMIFNLDGYCFPNKFSLLQNYANAFGQFMEMLVDLI